MPALTDKEIFDHIISGKISDTVSNNDYTSNASPIQPASLDLHVGKIYVPENGDSPGGINEPLRNSHSLHPGETALIEVNEKLSIPRDMTAIAFPPASMTVNGIIMTNPGIVDPGYEGRLTGVLINMGKDTYEIREGDIVFSLIILSLNKESTSSYIDRKGRKIRYVTNEQYSKLSKDFLNIEKRIECQLSSAKSELNKRGATWVAAITAIAALLAAALPVVTNYQTVYKEIASIRKDIDSIKETPAIKNER